MRIDSLCLLAVATFGGLANLAGCAASAPSPAQAQNDSAPPYSAATPAPSDGAAAAALTPDAPSGPRAPAAAPSAEGATQAGAGPAPASHPVKPAAELHPLPAPPADFAAPFAASAQPGDGRWRPWPSAESGLFTTTVHPGRFSRFKEMTLVAIDLRQLRLGWQIGRGEQGAETMTTAPGIIPSAMLPRAVAAFNGGFLARHGRWGIFSGGVTVQPQKPEGCTVAIDPAGKVQIATWLKLEHQPASTFATLRQGAPCLVEAGQLHADLVRGNSRRWAGLNPDRKTRRRSALGITPDGLTLLYAVGVETDPLDLARGMQAAGAGTATQLDINWSWTRLVAAPAAGAPWVPLREEMVVRAGEFTAKPSSRDFFYVFTAEREP